MSCESPKRTLGILYNPPSIPAPCDCYDEIIVPVGTLVGLFGRVGRLYFARSLLAMRVGMLSSKSTPIRQLAWAFANKSSELSTIIKDIYTKIDNLEIELSNIKNKILKFIEEASELQKSINSLERIFKNNIAKVREFAAKYNIDLDYLVHLKTNNPPNWYQDLQNYMSRIDPAIWNDISARMDLLKIDNIHLQNKKAFLENVIVSQRQSEAQQKIAAAAYNAEKQKLTTQRLFFVAGDKTIPSGTYEQQQAVLDSYAKAYQKKVRDVDSQIAGANEALSSGNNNRMSAIGDAIDGEYTDIASAAVRLLFDFLSAMAILEKRNCRESGMLDDNCECTICPPGKTLCEPILAPDIGIQPPLTRMGSELNYCLDSCCPGMELTPNLSSLSTIAGFFFYPCDCVCEDPEKTARPCQTSECGRKLICAGPEPDADQLGWFGSSKYSWDDQDCDWVCNNPCGDNCCAAGEHCCNGVCSPTVCVTPTPSAPQPTPTSSAPQPTPTSSVPQPTPEPTPTSSVPQPTPLPCSSIKEIKASVGGLGVSSSYEQPCFGNDPWWSGCTTLSPGQFRVQKDLCHGWKVAVQHQGSLHCSSDVGGIIGGVQVIIWSGGSSTNPTTIRYRKTWGYCIMLGPQGGCSPTNPPLIPPILGTLSPNVVGNTIDNIGVAPPECESSFSQYMQDIQMEAIG